MINSYVSEQLVRELEEMFKTALPTLPDIKNGITLQEIAYRSGVHDVIEALRFASEHGANDTPLL